MSGTDTGWRPVGPERRWLRYAFRRGFAPYLGIVWTRKFFGTADLAREAGEQVATARLAVGLRTCF